MSSPSFAECALEGSTRQSLGADYVMSCCFSEADDEYMQIAAVN